MTFIDRLRQISFNSALKWAAGIGLALLAFAWFRRDPSSNESRKRDDTSGYGSSESEDDSPPWWLPTLHFGGGYRRESSSSVLAEVLSGDTYESRYRLRIPGGGGPADWRV